MCDPLPETCGFNNDLHSSWQLTVSGKRIVDINGGIVLRLANIRGDIDLMLVERPWRRTGGPKNAGSRSVGFSSNAERSGGVVVVPRVPGNENVRRVGGHVGARSRDWLPSEVHL